MPLFPLPVREVTMPVAVWGPVRLVLVVLCFTWVFSVICPASAENPVRATQFCSSTSVNWGTLHRLTNNVCLLRTSCCGEVWEHCCFLFWFCFRVLFHIHDHVCLCASESYKRMSVCWWCVRPLISTNKKEKKSVFSACPVQFVHASQCVWVTPAHLKRVKSCPSQSDSASCRLCLCSGCVRHREIKKRARGRHTHFPVRRAGIRWDGEIFSLSAVSQRVRPLVAACHKGFPAQHLSLSKCEWQWRPASIQSGKIWQAWRDSIVHRVFRYLEKRHEPVCCPLTTESMCHCSHQVRHQCTLVFSFRSLYLAPPVSSFLGVQPRSPFGFECHLQAGPSVLNYFVYARLGMSVRTVLCPHACLLVRVYMCDYMFVCVLVGLCVCVC